MVGRAALGGAGSELHSRWSEKESVCGILGAVTRSKEDHLYEYWKCNELDVAGQTGLGDF